jgi:hypothetical protein
MEDEQNPQAVPAAPRTQPEEMPQNSSNEPRPAAYDLEGRPLYYAPPSAGAPAPAQTATLVPENQPQSVHMTRPIDPGRTEVPPDMQKLCEDSRRQHPQLNLSDGEYVISAVKRHPFGLVQIWITAFGLIAAFLALLIGYLTSQPTGTMNSAVLPLAITVLGIMFILILAGAVVASFVYNNNRFYLTNESVIQELQTGVFSKREQTVSLGSIEDASFRQDGILPALFNFGRIRLSTIGDETTYRFNYVSDPKKQIAILNNAVEAFKNGRRVH